VTSNWIPSPVDLDKPTNGIVWPKDCLYAISDDVCLLFVLLEFRYTNGLRGPLSPESWELVTTVLSCTTESPDTPTEIGIDGTIELGPYAVVRFGQDKGWYLESPPEYWERTLKDTERSQIVLTCSWKAVDDGIAVPPTYAAKGSVKYVGSTPARGIDQLKHYSFITSDGLPASMLDPHSFLLDADLLIDIERMLDGRTIGKSQKAELKDVLINLAYQDIWPGAAIAQLHRPSFRTVDARAAQHAYEASHAISTCSRAELANLVEGNWRPTTTLEEASEEPNDEALVATIFTYASLLKLRTLWSPNLTRTQRKLAFTKFVTFLADELRMVPIYTIQLAANMWLNDAHANSQAARLLKFSENLTEQQLKDIWGAACDVFLLSLQGTLEETLKDHEAQDAVIVTADKALVELRQLAPKIGIGVYANGNDGDARAALVLLNIPENVQLELKPLLDRLQDESVARAERREHYSYNLHHATSIVKNLEIQLLDPVK
jgi:hypothetical protein